MLCGSWGTFKTNSTAQHGGRDLVYVLCDVSKIWRCICSKRIIVLVSAFWIGHLQLFSCTVSLCQFVMILTSYIFLPLDLPGCCWSRSDETVSIRWHGAILCVPTEANSSHWFASMTVGLGRRTFQRVKEQNRGFTMKAYVVKHIHQAWVNLATFTDAELIILLKLVTMQEDLVRATKTWPMQKRSACRQGWKFGACKKWQIHTQLHYLNTSQLYNTFPDCDANEL